AIADLRQRPGLILAGAVALNVVLISLQVTTQSGGTLFQAVTFGSFAEVQRAATRVVGGVRDAWRGYFDLRAVRVENDALRAQLGTMQVELQVQRARAERADAYRSLLQFRARVALTTTGAEVIAASASPEFRTVTIDKGTSDGLAADMAVVAPAGLVGRVTRPSRRAALVQLIIDRNAAAGAVIERTRVQGIVVGLGDGTLRMDFAPATGDVVAGDVVVTSGIDGLYPGGFTLGRVERVGKGDGVYYEIIVRPSVDFFRLEDVLVVVAPLAAAPETKP
ncbi:MAG: rod shape-determining protein MreC, partial [Acidobacteriota bacterium]